MRRASAPGTGWRLTSSAAGARLSLQGVHLADHHQVGPLTAPLRQIPSVEMTLSHLHQGVRPPLRTGPLVTPIRRSRQGIERLAQNGAAFGVQQAVDGVQPVHQLGEIKVAPLEVAVCLFEAAVGVQLIGERAQWGYVRRDIHTPAPSLCAFG